MYLPVVEPRQSPSLWNRNSSRAHLLKSSASSSQSSRNNSTHNVAGWAGDYSTNFLTTANEPDAVHNFNYTIDEQEQAYMDRLQAIRMFGWDYLKPPGINKTMQTMIEEQEDYTDHEVDDEEAIEDNLIEQDLQNSEFEVTANNEDLILNNRPHQPNDEQQQQHQQQQPRTTTLIRGNGNLQASPLANGAHQQNLLDDDELTQDEDLDQAGDEEGEAEEEVDLDAEIAEASDHEYEYDDEYDEGDYDEGFMAEEEYGDENENRQERVQTPPPVVSIENGNDTALQQIVNNTPKPEVEDDDVAAMDSDEEELLFTYEPVIKPSISGDSDSGGDMSF